MNNNFQDKKKRKESKGLNDPDVQFLQDRSLQQRFVVGHGSKNPNESRKKFGKKNKSKARS